MFSSFNVSNFFGGASRSVADLTIHATFQRDRRDKGEETAYLNLIETAIADLAVEKELLTALQSGYGKKQDDGIQKGVLISYLILRSLSPEDDVEAQNPPARALLEKLIERKLVSAQDFSEAAKVEPKKTADISQLQISLRLSFEKAYPTNPASGGGFFSLVSDINAQFTSFQQEFTDQAATFTDQATTLISSTINAVVPTRIRPLLQYANGRTPLPIHVIDPNPFMRSFATSNSRSTVVPTPILQDDEEQPPRDHHDMSPQTSPLFFEENKQETEGEVRVLLSIQGFDPNSSLPTSFSHRTTSRLQPIFDEQERLRAEEAHLLEESTRRHLSSKDHQDTPRSSPTLQQSIDFQTLLARLEEGDEDSVDGASHKELEAPTTMNFSSICSASAGREFFNYGSNSRLVTPEPLRMGGKSPSTSPHSQSQGDGLEELMGPPRLTTEAKGYLSLSITDLQNSAPFARPSRTKGFEENGESVYEEEFPLPSSKSPQTEIDTGSVSTEAEKQVRFAPMSQWQWMDAPSRSESGTSTDDTLMTAVESMNKWLMIDTFDAMIVAKVIVWALMIFSFGAIYGFMVLVAESVDIAKDREIKQIVKEHNSGSQILSLQEKV